MALPDLLGSVSTFTVAAFTAVMFLAIWALSFVSQLAAHTCAKGRLSLVGAAHMLFSSDKKWNKKALPDPDTIRDAPVKSKVRVIFIRHGESIWNEVFNKGFGPSFLVRLVKNAISEAFLVPTPDSIFFDSPLSGEGLTQARQLRNWLAEYKYDQYDSTPATDDAVRALKGDLPGTIVTSSNLRRAIETATVALWDRLRRSPVERVRILSSLQEVTFNVDGVALAGPHVVPEVSMLKRELGPELVPNTRYDVSLNTGNKAVRTTGIARMQGFAEWATTQQEATTIIVAGHSLWFRFFFQTFLPASSVYEGKKKKLVNCGVVSFNLERAEVSQRPVYRIAPESLAMVYGGWS